MKQLPKIAIVGRPNVGKSALFNAIINKRVAIVDEEEGVTRDRIYGTAELFGQTFHVIDTGGMLSKSDRFANEVTEQAKIAIDESDAIIQVVDGALVLKLLIMKFLKLFGGQKKELFLLLTRWIMNTSKRNSMNSLSLAFNL